MQCTLEYTSYLYDDDEKCAQQEKHGQCKILHDAESRWVVYTHLACSDAN